MKAELGRRGTPPRDSECPVGEDDKQVLEADLVVAIEVSRATGARPPLGQERQQILEVDIAVAIDAYAVPDVVRGLGRGGVVPVLRAG